MNKAVTTVVTLFTMLAAGSALAQAVQVDAAIPAYQRGATVSGNLSSVGSDTMNNLMTLWSESFGKFYPNVKLQIEGKGSKRAPVCQTCHMPGGDHNVMTSWGFLALRLPVPVADPESAEPDVFENQQAVFHCYRLARHGSIGNERAVRRKRTRQLARALTADGVEAKLSRHADLFRQRLLIRHDHVAA